MHNKTLNIQISAFPVSTAEDSRSPLPSPKARSTRASSRTRISTPWKVSETLWPTVDTISIKKTNQDSIVRPGHVSRNIRDGVTQLLHDNNSISLEAWLGHTNIEILSPDQGFNFHCSECERIENSEHKHYTYRDYKTVQSVGECATNCRWEGTLPR